MIEARGYGGGVVTFDGQFVTISRRGLNRLTVGKGDKRIPVAAIASIQLKPAGWVFNGFIQFATAGGVERRSAFGRQTYDAIGDENSVVFWLRQQPAFEALRAQVEAAMVAVHPTAPAALDPMDQLRKLADLRSAGVLTEEEFHAAKAKLLGN